MAINKKASDKRANYYAMGLSKDEIELPLVGGVTSWNELSTNNIGLARQAQEAKRAIRDYNGFPREFTIAPAAIEPVTNCTGAKTSLIAREIISDSIELSARAHEFDALIGFAGCDMSLAGMIMAMARLDIPSMVIFGGRMLPGTQNGHLITIKDLFNSIADNLIGRINDSSMQELEMHSCPSAGSIKAQYSLSSMACISEALGFTLPCIATLPATDSEREKNAYIAGKTLMDLLDKNIKPSQILTKDAFENAATIIAALGCDTQSYIHLPAIASESGIAFDVDDILAIGEQTPLITDIQPFGTYSIDEFHASGGVTAALKSLSENGYLHPHCITITGNTISENLAPILPIPNHMIIKKPENPISVSSSVKGVSGNIATEGAIVQIRDSKMTVFSGPARCFNSEEEATHAIINNNYRDGDVIIIRYEGLKGGPGMREIVTPLLLLNAQEKLDKVAVITDGRFCNITSGLCIEHISPEAFIGGAIALVTDGDIVCINIDNKNIALKISNEELNKRRLSWHPPKTAFQSGAIWKYAHLVSSLKKGAVTHPGAKS